MALAVAATGAATAQEPERLAVAPSADFATIELGDPWDYGNPEDIVTDPNGPTLNVTTMRVADGGAIWTGEGVHYVSPHDMTIPGALPDSRDGVANPIDAVAYPQVSMRLRSPGGGAALEWFVCNTYDPDCFRQYAFNGPTKGWNIVHLDMSALSNEWRGPIYGLRLTNTSSGEHELDWLRVHAAGTPLGNVSSVETLDPGVDGRGGAARVVSLGGAMDTGALPPGRYRVSGAGGVQEVVVRAAPRPVVLDPDVTGGDDYAVVARGDAWDFSQATDWTRLSGVRDAILTGGVLQATNTSDQPYVELALGAPIDTARYHRLTVTMTYDGEFNLSFDPGGGSHGRVVFDHLGGAFSTISSKELITYQSRPTATWDLTSNLVGAAVEAGAAEFDAAPVSLLRWDPNEDPGARTWRLDEIRLAADDEADGIFPIRWRDGSNAEDTVVRIGIDRDRSGFDGPVVEVAGGSGDRVARVAVDGVRPGLVWPWIEIDDGTDVGRSYARAPLRVTGRIAGEDRIATGLVLSETAFPEGSSVAIVASARSFPDALAGTALAAAAEAPILLNERDQLDPRVADELRRLDPEEVIVLGGTAAISGSVLEAIAARVDGEVTRIAGADRYVTAADIAREAAARWVAAGIESSGDVILASGTTFPDALAAGQLAAATASAILLTPPDRLAAAARGALDDLEADRVIAIGGPTALSPATTDATDRRVDRIAGPDRYATGAAVRDRAVAAGADGADVVLASGRGFPDALAAGPYAASRGGTLLLTDPGGLPDVVRDRLVRGHLVVAGGRVAVSDVVLADALSIVYGGGRRADVLRVLR